jgi:hypothetical protein
MSFASINVHSSGVGCASNQMTGEQARSGQGPSLWSGDEAVDPLRGDAEAEQQGSHRKPGDLALRQSLHAEENESANIWMDWGMNEDLD